MRNSLLLSVVLIALSLVSVSQADELRPAGVASAHPLATRAAKEILQSGGNAFDAAVALTAALAVVEPYGSGLGGGGFWLLHIASEDKDIMIDGRERAPYSANRDMYLDDDDNVIPGLSIDGPLAAGIPGVPAALQYLAEAYGRLDLSTSLKPAINLARDGFPVDGMYRRLAGFRIKALQKYPDAARIFLDNNKVPAEGYVIKQAELASTLEMIANKGMDGFYQGEFADRLVDGMKQAGGIWNRHDLAEYQVVPREPITGSYYDMKITSAAPPSSGGIALIQMFNMLEKLDFEKQPVEKQTHLLTEVMRRAYRDRAEYLGDTDYVKVPQKKLISLDYATSLAGQIDQAKATPSSELKSAVSKTGGNNTTHFSVIDHDGNRVAATMSVNYPFGSGFVVPETGVLLNDEMDDFSSKPGVPNVYGLVGAEANAIAPGKRMLSSMSPTFLETDDRIAIIGTPGGSRIISMVLQAALAFYRGDSADDIVNLPRIHHQYLPDKLFSENKALSDEQIKYLQDKGHTVSVASQTWGNMQVVIWNKKTKKVDAASDLRGLGEATVIK